jgi:hypothetical protein
MNLKCLLLLLAILVFAQGANYKCAKSTRATCIAVATCTWDVTLATPACVAEVCSSTSILNDETKCSPIKECVFEGTCKTKDRSCYAVTSLATADACNAKTHCIYSTIGGN